MTILIDLFCLVLINRWGQWPCMPMPQRLRCFVRFQWKISSLSRDVFDNTNGMSNVKRLDQKCWLVDNIKFASGQRPNVRVVKNVACLSSLITMQAGPLVICPTNILWLI